MADWTNIPNANLEPGAPARALDALAFRENPIAIAEGAAGAPRVYLRALEQVSAGDSPRISYAAVTSRTIETFTESHRFNFAQGGSVRLKLEQRKGADSGTYNSEVRVRRGRAGSVTQLQLWSTSSSTFVSRAIDVPVLPGDYVAIEHRVTAELGGVSEVRNVTVNTAGEDFVPVGNFGFVVNNRAIL